MRSGRIRLPNVRIDDPFAATRSVVELALYFLSCGEGGSRETSAPHSGGNDRFCARLKTDISAFSSGLQGHLRSCRTILDSSRRPLTKNVRHDLVRPRRPELEAEMSVFNLAQKRSFPPLCACIHKERSARGLILDMEKPRLCAARHRGYWCPALEFPAGRGARGR
jgi:hypothetical protein